MTNIITVKIAKKVLSVVNKGLVNGLGKPVPDQMCVEAAVCYALGEPHGDNPSCVAPALRQLKIALNDSSWSSDTARAKGLKRLALIQLGSKYHLNEQVFTEKVALYVINKTLVYLFTILKIDPQIVENCRKSKTLEEASEAASEAARAASEAARAASEAARAASEAASDKILSDFAEGIVQILIDMKVPGCKWLYLTEK